VSSWALSLPPVARPLRRRPLPRPAGTRPEDAGLRGRPRRHRGHGHRPRREERARLGPARRRLRPARGGAGAGGAHLRPRRPAGGARGARAQPRHALRHQREHAEGPAAEPGVGDPLPRRDPSRARPAAHLLRPRHPPLPLHVENQQGIFGRILETQGGGYTALHDAIAVYLSRVADTPGRKVLVVFSDGDDTTSRTSSAEVMRMLRASSVTVYPVEFVGERRPGTSEALRAHSFLAGSPRPPAGASSSRTPRRSWPSSTSRSSTSWAAST